MQMELFTNISLANTHLRERLQVSYHSMRLNNRLMANIIIQKEKHSTVLKKITLKYMCLNFVFRLYKVFKLYLSV